MFKRSHAHGASRLLVLCAAFTVVLTVSSATVANANPTRGGAEAGDITELTGFTLKAEPLTDEEWVDPAIEFGFADQDLEPAPEFDASVFHESGTFATGIDTVRVDGQDLEVFVDRHVRVLQVKATLEREVERKAARIAIRRPRIGILLDRIDHELENEARLTYEIKILNEAIAEYAVRAFISEDEIESVLDELSTDMSGTRIVTDEVRGDQVAQIDDREAEFAARQERRAGYEDELRAVRSELRVLRRERLDLLASVRRMDELLERTEASYHVALHTRLPLFVEGTDIPLVALNAYVIAARTLEEEDPTCGLTWSMLAGIGRIESFHGHFEPSTLDINGDTTSDIRGPALDGRILEGAEFLTPGVDAPEATGRTETVTVAPSTAATDAEPPAALASADPAAGPVAGDQAATQPVPVVKRLALIRDSDGGRLDGDTTYDRAVGPMQFIPQTWKLFNADGNRDEESDPQNIYDASLASARYLCESTDTMKTLDGQERAYFAYNHDTEYTQNVIEAGIRYAKAIEIAEPDGTELTFHRGLADPAWDSNVAKAMEAQHEYARIEAPDW